MADLSSLLEKEEIEWPFEFKPIHLVPGENQVGDCWKVACFTESLVKSLEKELKKRTKQLEYYEIHLERLVQQSNSDLYDHDNFANVYEIEGEMSQMDVLITKMRERIIEIEAELSKLKTKYNMDDDEEDEPHEKRNKKKHYEMIVCYAKLVLNPFVIRYNNCINKKHHSDTLESQMNSFIGEYEKIKETMDNYWIGSSEKAGAIEIMCIDKITRKREPFNTTPSVAYITKGMENGSVMDYLQLLPNKNDIYQLEDSLLFNNLKKQIALLGYMENHGISHNNIKPSNVLISEDGHLLLLTDFCPETLFIERCFKMKNGKMTCSRFMSPEFRLLLTDEVPFKNVHRSKELVEKINARVENLDFPDKIKLFVHTNDVFCLGLIYYHLLTLTIPSDEELDHERVIHELKEMLKTRDHDLIDLVIRMVEFSPFERNSWEELLESLEK